MEPRAISTPTAGTQTAVAPLIEAFWSIQGEGRFVGQPMAFVRTATCPLRCTYCDTKHSYRAQPTVDLRRPDGTRDTLTNPVTAERVTAWLLDHTPERGAVSLTGGEPLVFPVFAHRLGERLRPAGRRLHLETAALDPAALAEVLPVIDHLSADYKLPSTLETGDPRARTLECLRLAAQSSASIDVKIVLTPTVPEAEWTRALDDLEPLARRIGLILQPVTPQPGSPQMGGVPPSRLLAATDEARHRGFDARAIPQMHTLLGID